MATTAELAAPAPTVDRPAVRDQTLPLFVVFAVVGTALGGIVLRFGAKITTDSATYLGVAHNLASGRGLTVPFVNTLDHFTPAQAIGFHGKVPLLLFGPFLSVLLAPFDRAGIDPRDVVPFLNAVLLGLTLGVTAVLAYRITRRSVLLAVAATLLVVHAHLLQAFSFLESEPLYITLALPALACLGRYLATRRNSYLYAFVGFTALACLTRYIGVSLLLTAFVALLAWSAGSLRDRAIRSVVTPLVAGLPLLLFRLYEGSLAGGNQRPITFRMPSARGWGSLVDTLGQWTLPGEPFATPSDTKRLVLGLAFVAVLAGLSVLSLATFRRERAHAHEVGDAPEADVVLVESQMLVRVVAVALVSLLLALAATKVLFDVTLDFYGNRLAVPALPLVWLLVFGVIGRAIAVLWQGRDARRAVAAVAVVGIVFGAVHIVNADKVIGWPDDSVAEHTDNPSPTWSFMSQFPSDTLVASSDPFGAWFGAGIDGISVPSRVWALSNTPNVHLDRDIEELRRGLAARHGYVVFTDLSTIFEPYLVTESDLVAKLNLVEVARFRDGRVYQLPSSAVQGGTP